MKTVKLDELLSRATAYELWRAPFDEKLQTASRWAGPAILLGLILILAVQPSLARKAARSLQLGQPTGWNVVLYRLSQLCVVVDIVGLGLYVVLWTETEGFQQGAARWHTAAMGEVAIGAANAFLAACAVATIIIAIVLGILAAFLALAALAGMGSSDS
jgi:hypothetical protein